MQSDYIYFSNVDTTSITPTMLVGFATMRDKRSQRDKHALDEDGMLVCNPRDREAAHRAQVEGIATENPKAVTCRKCLDRMDRQSEEST